MIDAEKMRDVAKQAKLDIAAQEERKKQNAAEALVHWWNVVGYWKLLQAIEVFAKLGKTSYTGHYEYEPPESALTALRELGFKVKTVRDRRVGGYNLLVEWLIKRG